MEIPQGVIDAVLGAGALVVSGFVKAMQSDLKRVRAELEAHRLSVAENYVPKVDYREGMRELREDLGEVKADIKSILAAIGPHHE